MIDREDYTWRASDGHAIPIKTWGADQEAATFELLAVHGLGGRDSDFLPLVPWVEGLGGRLVSVNLRGMGWEPNARARGHIRDGNRWGGYFHPSRCG